MIIFWEFNHFLILEGFDGRRFHLNDPATGRRVLSTEEFGASFSGVALVFNPGPEFQRGGVRANLLQRLPVWLHGAWGALAYPAAAGLMLAVLARSRRRHWAYSWTGCWEGASPGEVSWPG